MLRCLVSRRRSGRETVPHRSDLPSWSDRMLDSLSTFRRSTSRCINLFAKSISRTERGEIRTFFPRHQFLVSTATYRMHPSGIIHEKVLDMTKLAVGGMNMVPGDLFDAAEMRIFICPSIDPTRLCGLAPDRNGGAANGVAIAPNI